MLEYNQENLFVLCFHVDEAFDGLLLAIKA